MEAPVAKAEALERARQYRFRAEELRTISYGWTDSHTRQIISRVANDYDRMAAYLETHQSESAAQGV